MPADGLMRRYARDAESFDEQLAVFGIREGRVRRWIADCVRATATAPPLSTWPALPPDPLLAGWRWVENVQASSGFGLWDPVTHYWTPPSGGYVAAGFWSSDGGMAEAVPGWRISHKVTRARLTFYDDTDLHPDTVMGFGRVAIGWIPLPSMSAPRYCHKCYLELGPSGRCLECDE